MKLFLSCLLVVIATTFVALPVRAKDTDDLNLAKRLENAFVKVANDTSKSVVVISTTQKSGAQAQAGDSDEDEEPPAVPKEFEGTPFEFFFKRYHQPAPEKEINAQGSGIIFRADGYILTNSHVVRGAEKITVRLQDGKELEATVTGVDELTDVAIIKVNATDLAAPQFGNSDAIKVGQWAIAIGAPYQLDYSFTVGFISAKGRSAIGSHGGSAYEEYIQTDASINPGNSGGPLCNIEGQVIGINTLIHGLNRGIGFAIPINMARDIADKLIEKGRVVRPWLGIQIDALADDKELRETLKDIKDGVIVRAIRPKTPAAGSDLRPADIIVAVDGTEVKNPRELQLQVLRKPVGEPVTLKVIRDGKSLNVKLKTAELPDNRRVAVKPLPDKTAKDTTWGLTVQSLSAELAKQFDVERGTGVVITDVEPGSLAEEKGLQHGDVITEVNRQPVRNSEQFKATMDKVEKNKGALLYINRAGTSTFVLLKETE